MSVEPCMTRTDALGARVRQIEGVDIWLNEPLSRYTSFGVGGPADILVAPHTAAALAEVMRVTSVEGIAPVILGNGTNLLVRDGGVRGVVVLTTGLKQMEREGDSVIVEAGATLATACCHSAQQGLSGMEFAAGIPGTLGGALIMNAGAHGGEIGDITEWVEVVNADGSIRRYESAELGFEYRRSALRDIGAAIVRAMLNFVPGDPDEVHHALCEMMTVRCARQPVTMPSAGSIFKRPEGGYAGHLLEQAGAKDMQVGGAAVSGKHANFMVNKGGATASNVLALIGAARELVYDKFGVMLEPEVCVIGEDD